MSLATTATTRQHNDALYDRVATGDIVARDRLIEANIGLVHTRVRAFLTSFPKLRYLRNDMIAAGLLALTKACERMRLEGPVTGRNPTGYIYVCVSNAIGHLVEREISTVPDRTQRLARQKGHALRAPRHVSFGDRDIPDCREMVESETMAAIDAACQTDLDRTIVRMRREGHSDQDIADATDIARATIWVLRREIYARFLEQTGLKGEA